MKAKIISFCTCTIVFYIGGTVIGKSFYPFHWPQYTRELIGSFWIAITFASFIWQHLEFEFIRQKEKYPLFPPDVVGGFDSDDNDDKKEKA